MEQDTVGKQGFGFDVVEDVVVAASRNDAHAASEQLLAQEDSAEEEANAIRVPELEAPDIIISDGMYSAIQRYETP